jgi:hypothetical protein
MGLRAQKEGQAYHEGADKWQMEHSRNLVILAAELVVAWSVHGRLNGVAGGVSGFYSRCFLIYGEILWSETF